MRSQRRFVIRLEWCCQMAKVEFRFRPLNGHIVVEPILVETEQEEQLLELPDSAKAEVQDTEESKWKVLEMAEDCTTILHRGDIAFIDDIHVMPLEVNGEVVWHVHEKFVYGFLGRKSV